MVPLGLRHICFSPNSFTRASSGVMVAHCRPRQSSACRKGARPCALHAGPDLADRVSWGTCCWTERAALPCPILPFPGQSHVTRTGRAAKEVRHLDAHAVFLCAPAQLSATCQLPELCKGSTAGARIARTSGQGARPYLYGLGCVYRDLVVCCVAVLDAQVKVLYIQLQIGQNELCPTY